jgi:hypothetical protein
LDVSELVLDVTDCVLKRNGGLAVNFPLEHFLGQLGIGYELFHFLFSDVLINESHLPGDFIFDSVFIVELILLLFFQDVTDFFGQRNVKILFHFGLRFVLKLLE